MMKLAQNRVLGAFFSILIGLALSGCPQKPPDVALPANSAGEKPGVFTDVSAKAGINFELGHYGKSPLTILETLGGGAAFLDFDNDGWQDILLVGPGKVALYRNNQDGTFKDVTAGSGLKQEGVWQGIATGDFDNDGKMDVFLSGYRTCALYKNEGGGRFRDVTKEAGLTSGLWGSSACFVDVDNDGFLDLYVTHYVKFFPTSQQHCKQGGIDSTCGPTNYDPEIGTLYHNNKNGTFTDETVKRGLGDAHGNAMGVAIADYDGDGKIDIAVANDQLPGDMYRNKGNGYFENTGLSTSTAYDVDGKAHAGMGIDWADATSANRFDLIVTTYQHQPTSLYFQTAPGLFADSCYSAGIGQPTVNFVGFGVKFLDYDNDGLMDIAIANGHAVDNIAKTDSTTTYKQSPQLFKNIGAGKYEEASKLGGPAFQNPIVGRGLAVGDFNNDGRTDIILMDIEGRAQLLQNDLKTENHWLTLKLKGVKSNRDGIGSVLTITANKRTWKQIVSTTGSFLSASDVRPHIGLGGAKKADKIEILWPSGKKQTLTNVPGDGILEVTER